MYDSQEKDGKYAKMCWYPGDIQTLKPDWTLEQCEKWLQDNQKYIKDRLCELGFEVIEDLLPIKDEHHEDE